MIPMPSVKSKDRSCMGFDGHPSKLLTAHYVQCQCMELISFDIVSNQASLTPCSPEPSPRARLCFATMGKPFSHLTLPVLPQAGVCHCRLALHVMCFSNARAIAGLWQRFVRYLREACWDRGHLLPRMTPPSNPPSHHHTRQQHSDASAAVEQDTVGLPRPDFNCCLLHQKLQMLNLCIQQAHGTQAGQPVGPHSQQVGHSCRFACYLLISGLETMRLL